MNNSNFDYNTQREEIRLKEYGRNVQRIAEHVKSIEDEEERLKKAKSLVKLMKLINPAYKDNVENDQKMWDHLHIISDFDLQLEDVPYEIPESEVLVKKPLKVEYNSGRIKLKHYGKNIEYIIAKIIVEEDEHKKLAGISQVGKMMKKFYADFNRDEIEDDVIASQIEDISNGKIKVDLEKVKEHNLFFVSKAFLMSGDSNNNNNNQNNSGGYKKKSNKNKNKKRRK